MTTRDLNGFGLCQLFPHGRILGGQDATFSRATDNWQSVSPGDLFVARMTRDDDGHEAAVQAVAQGAVAVLAERPVPVGVPICLVDDTREAYGEVCHELAGRPARRVDTIGVSGSYGKGAVCELLQSVLKANGNSAAIGRLPGEGSQRPSSSSVTQLDGPAGTAAWLRRLATAEISHAIMHCNSTANAERSLAGLDLQAAVMTNLATANVDYHGNIANYVKAETRLFHALADGGVATLCTDDERSRQALAQLNRPALSAGLGPDAQISATLVERQAAEQVFLLNAGMESVPVRTRVIGDDHIRQCLSTTATALALGVDLATIVRGLEAVTSLPRRMQRVERGQSCSVFLDWADTPRRLAASLKTLKQLRVGRVICVCTADPSKSRESLALMGRAAEKGADLTIITNADAQETRSLASIHDVLDGVKRQAGPQISPNRRRAIEFALQQAKPGDCVLISGCASADMVNADETLPADDLDLVTDHLTSLPRPKTWGYGVSVN